MSMLSLVTAATAEPLSWPTAQKQIRQDGNDSDASFVETLLIPAVRERGEAATNRAFVGPQTWDFILDRFPDDVYIEIPKPPLLSIVSVTYVDTAGSTQTWASANYLVQKPAGPRCKRGRIALPYAAIWPVTQLQPGAVTIRFTCGYAAADGVTQDPAAVPALLQAAMLTDLAALYEHREAVVVDTRAASIEVPGLAADIYRRFKSVPTQCL